MTIDRNQALKNKVAVITGGNSGIGLAIATEFARQGARIVIFGRDQQTLAQAVNDIGSECLSVQGDVRKHQDLMRLFTQVKEHYGRIDTLVACAGGGTIQAFDEVTQESFDEQSDTLFKGVFFTLQQALPLLAEGASAIIISSVANVKGISGFSVYSAAKAAVRSLARTLTVELAPRKIRVNVISPGPVDTPIFGRMGIPIAAANAAKEAFATQIPIGRIGRPQEIANTALFLASDESAYVAGIDIAADGGYAQI